MLHRTSGLQQFSHLLARPTAKAVCICIRDTFGHKADHAALIYLLLSMGRLITRQIHVTYSVKLKTVCLSHIFRIGLTNDTRPH